jgi:monoterpene epsilon-lactone hydrolase
VLDATALPPYARLVDDRRAPLRRIALNAMLRLTAKRGWRLDLDVDRMRAQQQGFDARFAVVDSEARRTPQDCDGVAAEWIDVPETRTHRVLLYFHGGAFIFRFPLTHAGLAARWCRRLGARALMVDYRLAPEHPYPAAVDDCEAAYRWLLAQGTDPRDIVLAGDSAGGNLALATLLRVKAAGLPLPACAVLMSPFVDFTLSATSLITNEARDPIFTLAGGMLLRRLYLSPERFLDPAASPLFGDFTGLPPLLFQVGSTEMLLDESTRAAAKAHASGVTVELEIWRAMPHVFQVTTLPQAAAATDSAMRFACAHARWSR